MYFELRLLSHSFPKSRRLRKRTDFLSVQRGGKAMHTRYFVWVLCEGQGRLGITVSKRVGNAVVRNRIKRLVREFARSVSSLSSAMSAGAECSMHARSLAWLPANQDLVLIAKARRSKGDASQPVSGKSVSRTQLSRTQGTLWRSDLRRDLGVGLQTLFPTGLAPLGEVPGELL